MTLLRRRPREVYRVYSEEEYLGGAGTQLGGIAEWHAAEPELVELGSVEEWPVGVAELGSAGEWPLGEPEPAVGKEWPLEEPSLPFEESAGQHAEWDPSRSAGQQVGEHRLRRAAGVAMLAGVLGAVGCLVCLNLVRTHSGGAPGRRSLLAATRPSRVAGSAPAADDARPQLEPSRPVVVRPVETARSRVRSQSGASRKGGPDPRSSDRVPVHHPAHLHAGVVVLADYAHRRPSSGEASAAPVSAPASAPAPAQPAPQAGGTTTPAVAAAAAHPAPEGQAEFGFER
jgi:hypothetical protein